MSEYKDCIVVIDADTILFKAAKGLQENFITVRHNVKTTWTKEFKNVTTFYGRKKDRSGGWIAQMNKERAEDKQISASDFTIEEGARVINPDNYAFSDINKKIEQIMTATGCKDFILAIGGDSNFRYDVAQMTPYKGERKAKPIQLPVIVGWVKERYAGKIVMTEGEEVAQLVVADGEEADDVIAQYAHKDFLHHRATGEHIYVISYIDKDIDMCIAPSCNYDKLDLGIRVQTPYGAAKCFCSQMLKGDSTDNIPGLPNITPEIGEAYGIPVRSGIGPATIDALFVNANTVKKLFEVVVECYKSWYGEEEVEFVNYEGEVSTRRWINYLWENCQLLWMRREKGVEYPIRQTLTKMGIEWE